MRGIFITIEGPDGAGKTTQRELLKEYLEKKGYDVLITRDPGGNPISEAIREVILNKEFTEMAEECRNQLPPRKSRRPFGQLPGPGCEGRNLPAEGEHQTGA